jgi:hypothetical protein
VRIEVEEGVVLSSDEIVGGGRATAMAMLAEGRNN